MINKNDEIRSSFFLPKLDLYQEIEAGEVFAESPSNIALIKYWGKKEIQIPCNSSISFTLNISKTETTLKYKPKSNEGYDVKIFLDGVEKPAFLDKILTFFERIHPFLPFLQSYAFEIHTHNSFPHSAGIASSASGISALAFCLLQIERTMVGGMSEAEVLQKASFIARLGSGSACRSLYKGLVYWGENEIIPNSNKRFAVPYAQKVHANFLTYRDTILIIDQEEKKQKSTAGHKSMEDHFFANGRYQMAESNLLELMKVLENGDMMEFSKIVEREALSLHALMLSAQEPFVLIKPNTLVVLEKIWDFRKNTNLPLSFTIDAGANVHMLYPDSIAYEVKMLLDSDLIKLCVEGKYINDFVSF